MRHSAPGPSPVRQGGGYHRATNLPAAAASQLATDTGLPVHALATVRTFDYQGAPVERRRGGFPVLLYSPGLGFPRAFGTTLVQDLASHGFVVVAVDHTYDAAVVQFPEDRVERGIGPDPLLALQTRVADVRGIGHREPAAHVVDRRDRTIQHLHQLLEWKRMRAPEVGSGPATRPGVGPLPVESPLLQSRNPLASRIPSAALVNSA